MSGNYILDETGNPLPVRDVLEWARWFETADRSLASTQVCGRLVSTVFLGVDHAFDGGEPVLWETMIIGNDGNGRYEDFQERYTSRADAEAGHARAVAMVRDRETRR